jgi:hypothetical protein
MPRANLTTICCLTCIASTIAVAQTTTPQVPDSLKPPDTEVILLKALGKGKQIYVCSPKPADQTQFAWTLDRPQANLLDDSGTVIGKHYKGPIWEATDGSKVGGQVQQRANAPAGNAVPWLLLKATMHEGSGKLAHVTYIQRVDTQGGLAPGSGCDPSHAGADASADYQATYYFYTARQ